MHEERTSLLQQQQQQIKGKLSQIKCSVQASPLPSNSNQFAHWPSDR